MSQKSTPRSPRSPRSKSPSCEDVDGEQQEQTLEELQREVEEELRSSERVLIEARSSIAGSRGSRSRLAPINDGRNAQSRTSYQHSTSKPSSRIPSPRAASICEEDSPRLPSPPVSTVTYGSRGVTPGASHRSSRVPSPEYSGTNAYSATSRVQNADAEEDYCPEEAEPYKHTSNYSQMRGSPASRSPSPNSKLGSVTFGSKQQSGISYSSPERYNNEPSAGFGGTSSTKSALRMNTSNADAATSCPRLGPSYTDNATSNLRMGPSYVDNATSNLRMGPSYVDNATSNLRMGPSYVDNATSNLRMGPSYVDNATSNLRMGPSYVDNATSNLRIGPSYVDNATSNLRMGPSYVDNATSNLRMGPSYVDNATSNLRMGPSYVDNATSYLRMGPSYVDNAPSNLRIGPSYVDNAPSNLRIDSSHMDPPPSREGTCASRMDPSSLRLSTYERGTSAMTYKEQSSAFSGSNCSPGCRKFLQDIGETRPLTSTPVEEGCPPETKFIYDKLPSACSPGGGRRTCPPGPKAGRQMAPAEFGPHGHHGHHSSPLDAKSNFDYLATPPKFQQIGSGYHQHHSEESPERSSGRDEKVVSVLNHLSQLRKTPSCYRCGLNQGTDFLKVCCPKVKDGAKPKPSKFPEIPCLQQEELEDLIKCEAQDVDSMWYIMSDERKSYKKPCPKQQKAQMTVKALMQAHAGQICSQKEYFPLEHPDPEDISPEVAAAMVFSHERGIRLEECPNDTITSLFPEEPKTSFPEKIPASSISIVDRNSKDQEEMIEKSASVPSEGVSDSAYTRTMKGKGEDVGPQKSYDFEFAIGQSKREYILVAQKPQRINKVQYRGNTPPWFPGFFSAFPDFEGLKIVNSPSGLFHKAWVHSNPGNMQTSDVIVLD